MIRKICIIAVVGLFVTCFGQETLNTTAAANPPLLGSSLNGGPSGNSTGGMRPFGNFTGMGPPGMGPPGNFSGMGPFGNHTGMGTFGNHTGMGPPGNFTIMGPFGNHTGMGPPGLGQLGNSSLPGRPNGPPPPPPNLNATSQVPPNGNGKQEPGKKSSKAPKTSKKPKSKKTTKAGKSGKKGGSTTTLAAA